MNRGRNIALAMIGVVVVAGFLIGQLTSGDNAAERLLASSPSTSRPTATLAAPTRSGAGTTAAGIATDTTIVGTGTGSSTSTPSTAAGSSPTTAAGGGSAGTPGGTAAPRNSGVNGGIEESPAGTTPGSGRGGASGGTPGGGTNPTSTSSSTSVPGSTSTTAPFVAPNTLSLTKDDNGKAFTVKRNDYVLLRLDPANGAVWSEPSSAGSALTKEATSTLEGVLTTSFTASAPGTATITASASPVCTTASPPCLAASTGFTVTITVTP